MIGISKLYCGAVEASDVLRYKRRSNKLPSDMLQFSVDKKPVVVWNCTQTCNLKCAHCYAGSENKKYEGELTTEEAKTMIDDLAAYGAPVLLFSGGEPTMRPDLVELMKYAKEKGMRVVISTNGTLITEEKAKEYAEVGLSYVGVSLDGMQEVHDKFRGVEGSFERALRGLKNASDAGIKVGLRFTINKRNYTEIPKIFDLMEERNINRICLYHLVYAGRGTDLMNEDLTHEQSRQVVRYIMTRTRQMFNKGLHPEVLTVDNHADGPFLL
ncbi:MAG: radical SAM protein, partial [Coriobacteriia bacterium]|nr:radical SAM protein [Coriobacteriia bacterium]